MRQFFSSLFLFSILFAKAQSPLYIPTLLTGITFNLKVQNGSQIFFDNIPTPTYGINGPWMCPTLMVNKGDSIRLNVTNNLNVRTTIHWHGLHIAAKNDGGPHQIILPSMLWSPSFKVRNNAATYWYHPHGAGQTEQQISKGLAGLIIVKDSAEASLNLPRNYGVDDIPVIIQSKAFDALKQVAIATDMDTALFINGTLNPYLNLPAQVIRFRLLNASSLRSYNIGFSDSRVFYQLGTDGGLLDTPIARTRLIISPGERAEILVNFSGMMGQTINLENFGTELPSGIYGTKNLGMGADTIPEYKANFLNGADFKLLKLVIGAALTGAITNIPSTLIPLGSYSPSSATRQRSIVMDTIRLIAFDPPNRAEGPFGMNNRSFDIDSINEVVYLNSTEIWTLVNKTLVAHPFHIHDVQFNILNQGGNALSRSNKGWKDVVLVLPGDSVKFITRFADFADDMVPYMFHCHLLHHEDDGMMGSFKVINAAGIGIYGAAHTKFEIFPNPVNNFLTVRIENTNNDSSESNTRICILNLLGETVINQSAYQSFNIVDLSGLSKGIYLVKIASGKTSFIKKIILE